MKTGNKEKTDPPTHVFDWGHYAPPTSAKVLLYIISAGISRGSVRKIIFRIWKRFYPNIVDINKWGIKFRLNISDNNTDAKILTSSKIYDKEEILFLRKVCNDGIFVDIGANIGYYSLSALTSGAAKVIAIEPNLPTYSRLQFNIQSNGFKDQENIITLPLGVGPQGKMKLYSKDKDLGSATLIKPETNTGFQTSIQTRPLADILSTYSIEYISCIKVDIEGAEDQALVPYLHDLNPKLLPKSLIIEHCHNKYWKTNLLHLLQNIGYRQHLKNKSNIILINNL